MHAATIYDVGGDDKLMGFFHGPNIHNINSKHCKIYHVASLLYKNRKNISQVKINLDLTSSKFTLLKSCQAKVRGNRNVDFVFADVNLCVLVSGSFKYFNSEKQLDDILVRLN